MTDLINPRTLLLALFDAAVQRALPEHNTAAFLPPPPKGRTVVLGAGKAGGAMAAAVDALWPKHAPISGLVVTRYGHVPPAYKAALQKNAGRIEVVEAAHPVPDEAGQRATARIVQLTRGLSADDHGAARWWRWQEGRDHPAWQGTCNGGIEQRAQKAARVGVGRRHSGRRNKATHRMRIHANSTQLSARCTTSTFSRAPQGTTWRCSGKVST